MTLNELIEQLTDLADSYGEADPEVRLALQPRWAFEHSIRAVAVHDDGEGKEPIVYISEGGQIGYLPEGAKEAIGWS